MEDLPIPENYNEKEVYAFFGLAASFAQTFEKGLVNLVVTLATRGAKITQADYDEIFMQENSKTIERLINASRKAGFSFPNGLERQVVEAKNLRNFLNHDFFQCHAVNFATESGRRLMIDELLRISRCFLLADRDVAGFYKPLMAELGTDDKTIVLEMERLLAGQTTWLYHQSAPFGELGRSG